MSAIVATMPAYARKRNNYELDATGVTALWPADTTYKAEVPAGRRWFFLYGFYKRDVSSTAIVEIYDASDNVIGTLDYQGAGTAGIGYPNTSAGSIQYNGNRPIILDPGEYILITFATAQTAGAYASCVVLEVDM